jgi:hypothetical protein
MASSVSTHTKSFYPGLEKPSYCQVVTELLPERNIDVPSLCVLNLKRRQIG